MDPQEVLATAQAFLTARGEDQDVWEPIPKGPSFISVEDAGKDLDFRAAWRLSFFRKDEYNSATADEALTADWHPWVPVVYVDAETGEAWWFEYPSDKPTPTSWRNPWLKKRLAKAKAKQG